MLIAIAIAEEIQELQGLYRSSTSFLLLSCLRLWHKISQKAGKLLAKVRENSEAQNL